jgi:hypothetical protein
MLHIRVVVECSPHWDYPTICANTSLTQLQQFLVVVAQHHEDLKGPKSVNRIRQAQGKSVNILLVFFHIQGQCYSSYANIILDKKNPFSRQNCI